MNPMRRLMNQFRKPLVGLDIGSSSIKLVITSGSASALRLELFDVEPLPEDTIVGEEIMNSDAVVQALCALRDRNGLRGAKVALATPATSQMMLKLLSMPLEASALELEQLVRYEVNHGTAFPAQDAGTELDYDFHPQQERPEVGKRDVLVLAVRKAQVAQYVGEVRLAGFMPIFVEPEVVSLTNALERGYPEVMREPGLSFIYHIGAHYTSVTSLDKGEIFMATNVSEVGGDMITARLRQELGVSFEEAEQLKITEPDSRLVQDVMQGVLDNMLLAKLSKPIDFSIQQRHDLTPLRIYLTGGGGMMLALQEALQARTDLPVERWDPFQGLDIRADRLPPGLRSQAFQATVALGLSLHDKPDPKETAA